MNERERDLQILDKQLKAADSVCEEVRAASPAWRARKQDAAPLSPADLERRLAALRRPVH